MSVSIEGQGRWSRGWTRVFGPQQRVAMVRHAVFSGALISAVVLAPARPALALDVLPGERATRDACERKLCEIVLDRKLSGAPLRCDMVKTWDRTKIKKSGAKKAISWGFGDARCEVKLDIPRATIVPALESAKHTVQFERQTVDCKIEDGERKLTTLQVEAAPKIKFKDGRAYKVWINVRDVRGDSGLKSLVWAVSKLADGLGIFHKDSLKEINKLLYETCENEYGKGKSGKPAVKAGLR